MGRKMRRQCGKGRKNKKQREPTPKLQENDRIMHTPGGAKYMPLDVAGGGFCCGILSPIALKMFSKGIPLEDIVASVNGELTDDMKEYVQTLRGAVVDMSRDYFEFADGEELAEFADVVHNPVWAIMTRGMWEKVVLYLTGLVDGKAVWLWGKVLGLDGLRIVKHDDGLLMPCDAQGPLSSEDCPMVLHDGYGHFKALIPLHGMPLVSLVLFKVLCVSTSCAQVV